ncbi:MAG: hypothetical protein ACLT0Y_02555 [Christensenellales bacterium]
MEQNATVTQETANSEDTSCPPTMALISASLSAIPTGSAETKLTLYTLAKNVANNTSRMTGVINETKNRPLSLK